MAQLEVFADVLGLFDEHGMVAVEKLTALPADAGTTSVQGTVRDGTVLKTKIEKAPQGF